MVTEAIQTAGYSREQMDLLKRTVAGGTLTDDEFALFINVAQRTGLDPFRKQVHAIVYETRDGRQLSLQTGIDGYRSLAARNPKYAGQRGPFWCGPDGKWTDVWLEKGPPFAAKVGVCCTGYEEPVWAVARFDTYVQNYYDKTEKRWKPKAFWARGGDLMVAKCAEALALRRALPDTLSNLYIPEEMAHLESDYLGDPAGDPAPPMPLIEQPHPEDLFSKWAARIEESKDVATLEAVGREIKRDKHLDDGMKEELRASYKACKAQLESGDPGGPTAQEIDEVFGTGETKEPKRGKPLFEH